MNIGVLDFGAGNLHSLIKALSGDGRTVHIDADPLDAIRRDMLVLPGVGAFGPAAAALATGHDSVRDALHDGLPCLGVCLGMQLLFDESEEGAGAGVGFFRGRVTRLTARRVPHIGWNTVDDVSDPLFAASGLSSVYYANGYAARVDDESQVVAWTTHDNDRFPAAVRAKNVLGVQFHPEKSSQPGVAFMRAFLDQAAR